MEKMRARKKVNTKRIATIAILLAIMIIMAAIPLNIAGIRIAVLPLIVIYIACQVEGLVVGFFMGFIYGLLSLIFSFIAPNVMSPIFFNPLVSVAPRMLIGVTTYFSFVGMDKLFKYCFKRAEEKSEKKEGEIKLEDNAGKEEEKNNPEKVEKENLAKNAEKDKNLAYNKKGKKSERTKRRISILFSSGVSAAVGTITNTGLVVAMMYAFNAGKVFGDVTMNATYLLTSLIGINFVIEIVLAVVATPPLTLALRFALHKEDDELFKRKNKENKKSIKDKENLEDKDIYKENLEDKDIYKENLVNKNIDKDSEESKNAEEDNISVEKDIETDIKAKGRKKDIGIKTDNIKEGRGN